MLFFLGKTLNEVDPKDYLLLICLFYSFRLLLLSLSANIDRFLGSNIIFYKAILSSKNLFLAYIVTYFFELFEKAAYC
jgi:hypothetical protein